MDEALERAPVGVLTATTDGEVAAADDRAVDLLHADSGALPGQHLTSALPSTTDRRLQEAVSATPPEECAVEEYFPSVDRWLAVDVARTDDGTVVYLRDTTDRHERATSVERLRRRLDRTEAIDTLTATVLQTVVDAEDREAVARTLCERLGTTDLYEYAWVGERDPTGDGLRVVAAAGRGGDLADRIETHLDPPAAVSDDTAAAGAHQTPSLLEWRALRSGTTQVLDRVAAAETVPRDVRTAAFGQGLQSAVAVPLVSGDTVYGVLGLYAAREEGLSDRERASLETLGVVAGFAVEATRREDLLFADTVTTVEFRVEDDLPLSRAAGATGAEVSVTGVVPRDDDTVVAYAVTAGDAEQAVAALDDHDAVAGTRTVRSEDRTLVEVTVDGSTPVGALTNWGATVQRATYDPDGATVETWAPPDADPRRMVETVDAVAAETTVRSKTRESRTPRSAGGFRDDLDERLTEKQRRVLRTAYLSDYFASPRGSSSEEVADALDITGPTVLYHLRRAQRKLLDAYFDDDPDPDPGTVR